MTNKADALGFDVEYVPHKVMLFHPETGAPLLDEDGEQGWIEIEGYNSPAGETIAKQQKLRIQAQARAGRKQQADVDLDKARAENADVLARLTKNWHLVSLAGKKIEGFECTYENARDFYNSKARAWVSRDLLEALSEASNFIQT